jgi:hypothetical protein
MRVYPSNLMNAVATIASPTAYVELLALVDIVWSGSYLGIRVDPTELGGRAVATDYQADIGYGVEQLQASIRDARCHIWCEAASIKNSARGGLKRRGTLHFRCKSVLRT